MSKNGAFRVATTVLLKPHIMVNTDDVETLTLYLVFVSFDSETFHFLAAKNRGKLSETEFRLIFDNGKQITAYGFFGDNTSKDSKNTNARSVHTWFYIYGITDLLSKQNLKSITLQGKTISFTAFKTSSLFSQLISEALNYYYESQVKKQQRLLKELDEEMKKRKNVTVPPSEIEL